MATAAKAESASSRAIRLTPRSNAAGSTNGLVHWTKTNTSGSTLIQSRYCSACSRAASELAVSPDRAAGLEITAAPASWAARAMSPSSVLT